VFHPGLKLLRQFVIYGNGDSLHMAGIRLVSICEG
jgi:hypothetical protein